MSALPSRADMLRGGSDVGYVPIAGIVELTYPLDAGRQEDARAGLAGEV